MEKKDLNLFIYNHIKENSKLPKHSDEEKSKYSYHCKKLLEQGLIEKKGYGVWIAKEVQTSSTLLSHITNDSTPDIRSHGYRFYIKLPYLEFWANRKRYFQKIGLKFTNIPQGEIFKARRHTIKVYNDAMEVCFRKNKSYLTDDPEKGDLKALIEFKHTLLAIQRKIRSPINFGRNYMFSCHHANIRNAIAKDHLDKGITKFSIRDKNGVEWLIMDNSFNLMELETIHKKTATKDMKTIVQPFMNTLKEDPYYFSNMKKDFEETKVELNNIIKNQAEMLLETQRQLEMQSMLITTLMNEIKKKL